MEMIQAIRDWVQNRINVAVCKIDQDSILRKTGDASKVTSRIKEIKERKLPTSGEDLRTMLGKVVKYLGDIKPIAFSQDYGDLRNKPVKSIDLGFHNAASAAIEKIIYKIEGSHVMSDFNNWPDDVFLLYGQGGSASTTKRGTADFIRAYLVYRKNADTDTGAGGGYGMIQLGSWGSTARWTISATLSTTTTVGCYGLVLKVPKGSWAEVSALELS